MATMYDISEETGLSTATVSRVINNDSRVADKTRRRVVKAMKKLNYTPNLGARLLAGKKTDTIGVILPEIDNGYYVRVLQGINDSVNESKLHQLVSFYQNEKQMEELLKFMGTSARTDALILVNNSLPLEKLEKMVPPTLPVVLIGSRTESSSTFDIVGLDNVNGARLAMDHFLNRKKKRITLLAGPNHYLASSQRLEGVKLACLNHNHDFSTIRIIKGFFTYETGREAMLQALDEDPVPPEAVFAFNDQMALGAMDVLKERGIQVPEEVSIIGFDDNDIAQYAGLSTIRAPMRDIGSVAAEMAIRRMKNRATSPTTTLLKVNLILRNSAV